MLTEIKTGIKTGKQKAPNNIKMGEHGRGWLNLVTVPIAFHKWSGVETWDVVADAPLGAERPQASISQAKRVPSTGVRM